MGIKNTYINWRGFYFRLVHDVKNYHMALPNCHYVKYRFFGHSHEYNQNSKAIWLPPLSNNCPNIAGKQQPGFMVIGVRNGVMEAQKMVVTNNNVSRGPILRKEIL